jgi:hypothetical protein
MKIIVNSKLLYRALNECQTNDAYFIDRDGKNSITLSNKLTSYTYEISCHIKESTDARPMDRIAMYRLKVFIKQLEEQPIVVDFGYDRISVSCEKTIHF